MEGVTGSIPVAPTKNQQLARQCQEHWQAPGKFPTRQTYVKKRVGPKATIDEHRLVMQRLLGRKLHRNEVVHHKNGDPTDNRLDNLELMSRRDHSRLHAVGRPCFENARTRRGTEVRNSILTETTVREIRAAVANGERPVDVARRYRVHRATIRDVINGRSWGWVQ